MSFTPSQERFVRSRCTYPAFVGGYGSGKTFAAIARALALKGAFPHCDVAYYLPTYPLVADVAGQRFPAYLEERRVAFKMVGGAAPEIRFPGKGRILLRNMGSPESIVGYEVGHSICDELDTLPLDKASVVWNKIIARNRQKLGADFPNTVGVATTPEGFRFVYERWKKNPAPGYELIQAKTEENARHLPAGYIENLRNTYGSAHLAAYLDGQFVNMAAGSVYAEFDRALNAVPLGEGIQTGETLHVGMDFNVGQMAAVIAVLRGDDPYFVDEVAKTLDTPAMISVLKNRYPGHAIMVYPDASGGSRKSANASVTDIALLKAAGFRICVDAANPAVKDRVLAVNRMIHHQGVRRLRINPQACPHLVEALEKQAYDKNGEPDKAGGFDHHADALGYVVHYRYPIVKRSATYEKFRM